MWFRGAGLEASPPAVTLCPHPSSPASSSTSTSPSHTPVRIGSGLEELTTSERAAVALVACGLFDDEIADRLVITAATTLDRFDGP